MRPPRLHLITDIPHNNFYPLVTLPDDYYALLPHVDQSRLSDVLKRKAEGLEQLAGCPIPSLHWDRERGLYHIEIPMSGATLFLEEGELEYHAHNVHTPIEALALMTLGLDYSAMIAEYSGFLGQK